MSTDPTEGIGDPEFADLEFDLAATPESAAPSLPSAPFKGSVIKGPIWGREDIGIEQAVLEVLDNDNDFSSQEHRASRQIAEFLICVKGLCCDLDNVKKQDGAHDFRNRLANIMAVADKITSDRLEVLEKYFEREFFRQFLHAFEVLAEWNDGVFFAAALEDFKKAAKKLVTEYRLAVEQNKLPVPKDPVYQEVFSNEVIL